MKKILFATSALVAAGFVSSASAAEWETGVSGYYFLGVAYSGNDVGANDNGFGVLRDGEFHINGSLTADNGLVFAARVEVESFTSGDQIDENWGAVRSSFGRIMIGGNDDAAASYMTNIGVTYAPGARIGYYDAFRLNDQDVFTAVANSSDDVGIHYDTPNFMGFQAGATYIPDVDSDGGSDSNNPVFEGSSAADFWAVGAQYEGDFGDFGFGLAGSYFDNGGGGIDGWGVAANVSFAGFKVTGLYEDDDTEEFAIGASYSTGPWTIGAGYSNDNVAGPNDDLAAGWITYAVAPGVLVTGGLEYADNASSDGEIGGLAYLTLRF